MPVDGTNSSRKLSPAPSPVGMRLQVAGTSVWAEASGEAASRAASATRKTARVRSARGPRGGTGVSDSALLGSVRESRVSTGGGGAAWTVVPTGTVSIPRPGSVRFTSLGRLLPSRHCQCPPLAVVSQGTSSAREKGMFVPHSVAPVPPKWEERCTKPKLSGHSTNAAGAPCLVPRRS